MYDHINAALLNVKDVFRKHLILNFWTVVYSLESFGQKLFTCLDFPVGLSEYEAALSCIEVQSHSRWQSVKRFSELDLDPHQTAPIVEWMYTAQTWTAY